MEKIRSKGYAAAGFLRHYLRLIEFEREPPKADEVLIEILYCGVCHSDLHQVRNDWKNTIYPCLPGHEIIGKVTEAGSSSGFQPGEIVGVGCMIDSCGECTSCKCHEEQYCEGPVSWTATYNGYAKPDSSKFNTYGGYSDHIVVKASFVLRIPHALDISAAAPLLCAGVTTYSPLKHWNVGSGDRVAIIGLGGLGHVAVKLAHAMGAIVSVITTSSDKQEDALWLGAKEAFLSSNDEAMEAHESTFDFILDTIPERHDVNEFVKLLKRDGTLVAVGLLGYFRREANNQELIMHRRSVAGSLIGSIRETQEVLDFCAEHSILPDVEIIPIQQINEAFQRMEKEEVRFRFVIDMKSLENE